VGGRGDEGDESERVERWRSGYESRQCSSLRVGVRRNLLDVAVRRQGNPLRQLLLQAGLLVRLAGGGGPGSDPSGTPALARLTAAAGRRSARLAIVLFASLPPEGEEADDLEEDAGERLPVGREWGAQGPSASRAQ
jgi:hypothetical protein